jgi:hypothetical protein
MRKSLITIAILSIASAQNNPYKNDDYYHQDYYQENDNLYANYAARQNDKANRRFGVGGAFGILASGLTGYLLGSKRHPRGLPKLRFRKKQRVKCNMGMRWEEGTIIETWHLEQNQGQFMYLPYRVRLDDGSVIYAPRDDDSVIRGMKK